MAVNGKGNTSKSLADAMKAKKDEFYTQLTDIEKEMRYYRDYFRGKIVFCNCDDPFESNFFKYFTMNFNSFNKIYTNFRITERAIAPGRKITYEDIRTVRIRRSCR